MMFPLRSTLWYRLRFRHNGVDSGVSKTINAPYHTDKSEVSEAFFKAWEMGCKGITFYRDGSRDVQALIHQKRKWWT